MISIENVEEDAAGMELNGMYDLIERSQSGDTAAHKKLLEDNSDLLRAVVRRFSGYGVEVDDLYQVGCIGFLKAVDSFNPQLGTRFSTHAVPKIAGEIRKFLREQTSLHTKSPED